MSERPTSTAPAWMYVAVTSATLVVALALGEGVLRAFVKRPLRRVLPEVTYQPHPVRHFTLRPNQQAFSYGVPARIDHRGFRAGVAPPGGAGPLSTVLALGDSFTFGLGVLDEETWPSQLQRRLAAGGLDRVEVVNAGTISYGVFQELDLLKTEGLDIRPQLVVHALYWNDFMNAAPPVPGAASVVDGNGYFTWDRLGETRTGVRAFASTAISSSALLSTVRQMAGAVRQQVPASAYGVAYARFLKEGLAAAEWEVLERFYRDLKRLAAEHGFDLFVMVPPVSGIVQAGGAVKDHPYPVGARRMLQQLDIPFLDAFQLWSDKGYGMDMFLPEPVDAHLNAKGYEAISGALGAAVLENARLRGKLVGGRQ